MPPGPPPHPSPHLGIAGTDWHNASSKLSLSLALCIYAHIGIPFQCRTYPFSLDFGCSTSHCCRPPFCVHVTQEHLDPEVILVQKQQQHQFPGWNSKRIYTGLGPSRCALRCILYNIRMRVDRRWRRRSLLTRGLGIVTTRRSSPPLTTPFSFQYSN